MGDKRSRIERLEKANPTNGEKPVLFVEHMTADDIFLRPPAHDHPEPQILTPEMIDELSEHFFVVIVEIDPRDQETDTDIG